MRRYLHHLYVAISLFEHMTAKERVLSADLQKKMKTFFCTKIYLKERTRKTDKEKFSPAPLLKEKEKKEKDEKTTATVGDANSAADLSYLERRQEAFREECLKYVGQVDSDLLTDFYLYWSDYNEKTGKMRFEYEKAWNLDCRIRKWVRNQYASASRAAAIRLKRERKKAQKEVAAMEQAQVAAEERRKADEREAQKSREAKEQQMLTDEYLLKNPDGILAKIARSGTPSQHRER